MIYLAYAIVAFIVVSLSVKASEYVDMLEKTTNLSGALLGGILLSSVTSLPELFTSISATMFLGKPELCIGNILGSNLFNLSVLALLLFFSLQAFSRAAISASHAKVAFCVMVIYLIIALNMFGILSFEIVTWSVTSCLTILFYIAGVKAMAETTVQEEPQREGEARLSLRQLLIRFFFTSVGIIVFSVIITYITDEISLRLNLGAGMAGALFLGIATSLPEVSSTYTLIGMKNFDIAVGNIIGSNLFNLLILAVADLLYEGSGVYDFSDLKTQNLLILGLIATPALLFVLGSRSRWIKGGGCACMTACYIWFLCM